MGAHAGGPTIDAVRAHAFTVPTDSPEADGSFGWTSTTLVIVDVQAGGVSGLGYTYAAKEVGRIEVDERDRATGVHYLRNGEWRFQRARNVVVAGYAIETPRLLLLLTCAAG